MHTCFSAVSPCSLGAKMYISRWRLGSSSTTSCLLTQHSVLVGFKLGACAPCWELHSPCYATHSASKQLGASNALLQVPGLHQGFRTSGLRTRGARQGLRVGPNRIWEVEGPSSSEELHLQSTARCAADRTGCVCSAW